MPPKEIIVDTKPLHMGEIQDWWLIPGELDIANIMTQGCTVKGAEGRIEENLCKKSTGKVMAHARQWKQAPAKKFPEEWGPEIR